MASKRAGLAGALALLLAASPLGAKAARVADLTGLDPAGVRARLASVPADWPVPRAFQIATPDGQLTFLAADALMMDPVLAQRMAAFRTRADPLPWAPYLQCRVVLRSGEGTPQPAGSVIFVFRNGHLEGAFQPIYPPPPLAPPATDRAAIVAYARQPVTSLFIARFGELPLEDGLGFLSRWTKAALLPADELSAACAPAAPPPARTRAPHHALDASDMQGLALLPFAISLPGMNHQRVAARREGAEVLAALRVGDTLATAPAKFAAAHPGVRSYPAKAGDYAVLTIDMGAYPGRNLSNSNDSALVGVRRGRIEWISPPASFGPRGELLCLDDHGVPNTPRRGCSGWGQFAP